MKTFEILLVEDNEGDIILTTESLEDSKLIKNINVVKNGKDAVDFVMKEGNYVMANRPDLILLDIGLPGEDGISIAKRLKETPGLTVVMLTARSSLEDRALSLESGADNYLVKPVSLRELQAVIERVSQKLRTGVVGSPKSWYLLRYECVLRSPLGKNITLTASEFKLLECMIAHRGQPANRRELIEAQGHNFLTYDERRIEVKISRLRKKIREITELDDPIKAEWGLGYAFSAPCSLQ